ncbi:hypothetical protein NQ315_007804 [Exocentrus adspersus]|uniref:Cyclin A n=1 Tax=Exocentrus adspersus TaxID=1586481 RepID=A0AAV8W8P1_9CUCU|nr:hypothetical protein NQ315_007804 [Exocentrus adspersus]
MASIRIHEDQENRVPEIRQKQATMAVQQKRSVLGLIENDKQRTNAQNKAKQPLGLANVKVGGKNFDENEECRKENRKNLVNPIVPVAQFQAFKVYEDKAYEERMREIEEKLKRKIKPSTTLVQVYKGTSEDKRFYTKTEVAELERKQVEEDAAKGVYHTKPPLLLDSPSVMFIENSSALDVSPNIVETVLRPSKSNKDIFFEMEEYRNDIYKYLLEHELKHRPKPGYMKKQPDVTSNMRTILVDWLVEVGEEYKLHTETLYLSINFIDRFLSYMSVVRGKLQLVGTAAIFLASKYEEIYPPDISEFVYITDDTYTKRQVIRMEHLILKVLGFDISVASSLTFITAMCVMNGLNQKTTFLAMYLSELALLNGDVYLEFLPSVLAASAIAVARHTLGEEAWNEQLVASTGYRLIALKEGVEFLTQMFTLAPTYPQQAIQDKYKHQKYMHVSQMIPSETPIVFK